MSSMTGETIKVSIFGQSHGEGIGVVVDGFPSGEEIDLAALSLFLQRRAPGGSLSTKRKETDAPRFLSGLVDGRTCGAPLCAVIENADTRSGDYDALRFIPRPSHADYPASVRYGGHQDVRGGGHFSGRLTAPLCVAGGIALQMLARRGVFVGAHAQEVGGARDALFDPVHLTREALHTPATRAVPTLDEAAGGEMARRIRQAAEEGDSVGGIIECAAVGLPAGIGDPMFGGLENRLSAAVFGIPAIRGIEFGAGFGAAQMRGSEHNDPYCVTDGEVRAMTNHSGGIIGGISSGMPIVLRVAVKPTPSIAREQQSVDLRTMAPTPLTITGRHDPCIVLRAVPCVEAAVALVLLDALS